MAPDLTMAERLRRQSTACSELGSPLYAALLTRAAVDYELGGVVAGVLEDYEESLPGAAVALRMTGAVHRIVLDRRAPALAVHYPSVGGRYLPGDRDVDDAIWAGFRQVLIDHRGEVHEVLTRAPQTNETGRSLPLLGALAVISRRSGGRPVRLVEIGASAGLNLRADALAPLHRCVDLDALPAAPPYAVVERLGCDLDPVDPTTTEGRLTLTSYVWPDDILRFERLRAALDIAARVPAKVEKGDATELLQRLDLESGTVTVLWHSVMWQYLDPSGQNDVLREVERLAGRATADRPLAHVSFEPAADPAADFDVRLRWTMGSESADEVIGTAPPHGVPVTWAQSVG